MRSTEKTWAIRLLQLLTLCLMSFTASAGQPAKDDNNSRSDSYAYVDSVYEWGSWELGLQPAAGGAVERPQRAAKLRTARIRPDQNSAVAPRLIPIEPRSISTKPSSRPLRPGETPPRGGPGDRFIQ